MLFSLGWCFLIPFYLVTEVLSYLIRQDTYSTLAIVNDILSLLVAPFLCIILVTWILIHFRLFRLPLTHIQTAIASIKEDLKKKFIKSIPVEDEDKDYDNDP